MTPFEASNNTAKLATHKLVPNLIFSNNIKNKLPKFQVGDFVRVPDKRNIYSKGYTTNWNREVLKIYKLSNINPVTYGLVDENNEQ